MDGKFSKSRKSVFTTIYLDIESFQGSININCLEGSDHTEAENGRKRTPIHQILTVPL